MYLLAAREASPPPPAEPTKPQSSNTHTTKFGEESCNDCTCIILTFGLSPSDVAFKVAKQTNGSIDKPEPAPALAHLTAASFFLPTIAFNSKQGVERVLWVFWTKLQLLTLIQFHTEQK